MAPQWSETNAVLFENDVETDDLALTKAPVQEARTYQHQYVWYVIVYALIFYPLGLYGGYLALVSAKWQTNIFAFLLYCAAILGITAGSHRLWSHRSYKAKWPLHFILMVFQTFGLQWSAINWVRDHRMHHKYVDTDADPHNATRGFFFSHIGWLMVEKHPEYERKVNGVDISDVQANAILRFQQKYYAVLLLLICYVLPTLISVYLWNESWSNAFLVAVCFRLILSSNVTFTVNSVAHKWGYRPYDKNMMAAEVLPLSIFMLGEGYHNYHHAFPWDYRGSEFGAGALALTTLFIDFFAKIGWAYDLKTISDDVIQKRVLRTGDGSHHLWKGGEKDQPEEHQNASSIKHD